MTLRKPYARGLPSPLVEAVTKYKGKWEVHEAPEVGVTNNVDHVMYVPLDDEACRCGVSHGDSVRTHELLHSKLSPESKAAIEVVVGTSTIPVSSANVEAAEEFRINYCLKQVMGDEDLQNLWCEVGAKANVAGFMDAGRYADLIRWSLSGGPGFARWTRPAGPVIKGLRAYIGTLRRIKDPKMADTRDKRIKIANALLKALNVYNTAAVRIMTEHGYGDKLPSWAATEQLAAFLEVNLREVNDQIAEILGDKPSSTSDLDRYLRGGETKPKDLRPRVKTVKPETPRASSITGKTGKTGEPTKFTPGDRAPRSSAGVEWGKPDAITEAPMSQKLPAWKSQKKSRATDEGTIPRFMHRMAIDQRVFHRTKRIPGGSLVVDDSGSMGLKSKDLDDLIEVAPASIVAVYAGNDGRHGGEIRVVAKDGKRTSKDNLSIKEFGGNGIDGPALEWLGQQPEPRIWISDGGVSSLSGFDDKTHQAARDLCLKHNINMVGTAEQAVEMLKTGRFYR